MGRTAQFQVRWLLPSWISSGEDTGGVSTKTKTKTLAVYRQRQRQRHWWCIDNEHNIIIATIIPYWISSYSFNQRIFIYSMHQCLLGLKQRLNVQKDDPENTQIMTPRIDRFRRWAHSSNYVNVFDNFPGTMTSMLIRAQSMLSRFKPQRIIRLKSH